MKDNTRNWETEDRVRSFYEEEGWSVGAAGIHHDTNLYEDLRPNASTYVSASRRKPLAHLPESGDLLLDAASGPVQYPEYLEYSSGFSKHVCVDISQKALDHAREKLGSRGEYVLASILELPFPDNHFDAAVSLHTLYHIDRSQQEVAVRQLIRVVRPGRSIVIVYRNPYDLFFFLRKPLKLLKRLLNSENTGTSYDLLYFHAHSLRWWNRFSDQCNVTILPWRVLQPDAAKLLIPNSKLGELMFRGVMTFERLFPRLATLLGSYPMIVLKKKS